MLSFYKNLPIAAKLFLSNLAFALPMAVLIFFLYEYQLHLRHQTKFKR